MRKSLILSACLVLLCVAAGFAGLIWQPGSLDNSEGELIWVDRPTPASYWHRDTAGNAYCIGYAWLFDSTPKLKESSGETYYTGFWELDGSGDIAMKNLSGFSTTHQDERWSRKDAQWGMDSNGDIFPQP